MQLWRREVKDCTILSESGETEKSRKIWVLHRSYEDGPFLVLSTVITLAQGDGEVAVVDAPLGAMANTADVERGVPVLVCWRSACFLGCISY